jgi:hypothetical protein
MFLALDLVIGVPFCWSVFGIWTWVFQAEYTLVLARSEAGVSMTCGVCSERVGVSREDRYSLVEFFNSGKGPIRISSSLSRLVAFLRGFLVHAPIRLGFQFV